MIPPLYLLEHFQTLQTLETILKPFYILDVLKRIQGHYSAVFFRRFQGFRGILGAFRHGCKDITGASGCLKRVSEDFRAFRGRFRRFQGYSLGYQGFSRSFQWVSRSSKAISGASRRYQRRSRRIQIGFRWFSGFSGALKGHSRGLQVVLAVSRTFYKRFETS